MKKFNMITVQNIEISIATENNDDYICLTDMTKSREGEDHIRNWMRNRYTIEFLGTWEVLHNPAFQGVEFDTFLYEAGANSFNMTPRKWIEATNAIGIISKAGRNGGTYAHKVALFGKTAQQWRSENPQTKGNIRDEAALEQLVVLSNLESINALLIRQNLSQRERWIQLNQVAITQLQSLFGNPHIKRLSDGNN